MTRKRWKRWIGLLPPPADRLQSLKIHIYRNRYYNLVLILYQAWFSVHYLQSLTYSSQQPISQIRKMKRQSEVTGMGRAQIHTEVAWLESSLVRVTLKHIVTYNIKCFSISFSINKSSMFLILHSNITAHSLLYQRPTNNGPCKIYLVNKILFRAQPCPFVYVLSTTAFVLTWHGVHRCGRALLT